METVNWISFGIALLYLIEKVMLKTKKCKSKCCCAEIETEMTSINSPRKDKQDETQLKDIKINE
jgi:hypothetical protein